MLEGGEGSGKSTQAKRLVSGSSPAGRDAMLTHEPGHTRVGEEIRLLLLHARLAARSRAPSCC